TKARSIDSEPFAKFLDRMLLAIKGAWPNFSEEKQGQLYAGLLKDWAGVYGRQALQKTIKDAINAEPELPSPADFKKYLPVGAAKLRGVTDATCPDCEGSGWMPIFHGKTMCGNDIEPNVGAVRRCGCWRVA